MDTSEIIHIDPIVVMDDETYEKASDRSKMARFNESKHLKGQLDPPVSDVTFFGSKEVCWGPPLVA